MTDTTSSPITTSAETAPGDAAPVTATATDGNGSGGNGGSGSGIQSKALRGASFLFGREGIGAVVRLVGIIITVREIGPSDYGIYTAAAAFVTVVVTICQMGAEIYLIRVKEEPNDRLNNEVFTLLLITSVAATVISIGLSFALLPFLRPVGVALPLRVLLLCIPINVLWAPAQAYIERRFDYKKMGILELGGDCVLYATAVPLAILHFGAWSLVIGYFAWQTFLLVGSLILSGLRPRWAWSSATAKDVIRHGTSYSTASLFVNMPAVINALVVGSLVGAAGVGYVSFARNLVTTVGFAKRAAYRLGIVTMSQLNRDDPGKFRQGLERGSFLLTLSLGVPFAVFGLAAHWVIPDLFGHEWSASLPIYCLLSLAFVLGTAGQIEASLFYALGKNMTVAVTALLQAILLTVFSIGMVELWGVNGFGIASVVALVSFLYSDRQMRKLATYTMRLTVMVSLILAPSMFLPMVPPPVGLVLLVPWGLFLVIKPLRTQIPELWRSLVHALRGSAALA
jgi:O-antigen/teichoic acid export membrane protein